MFSVWRRCRALPNEKTQHCPGVANTFFKKSEAGCPASEKAGRLNASNGGGMSRFDSIYNDMADIDRLLEALS